MQAGSRSVFLERKSVFFNMQCSATLIRGLRCKKPPAQRTLRGLADEQFGVANILLADYATRRKASRLQAYAAKEAFKAGIGMKAYKPRIYLQERDAA